MNQRLQQRGFTLVEILVVVGLFGLVMASVFSVYLTHMKNAYKQDDALETQQNLRIGIDSITKDLKMAGMLLPTGTNALAAGVLGSYSTCLKINTSSAYGIYARLGKSKATLAYSNFSTLLDTPDAVDGFQAGDRVRLVRPFDNSQPLRSAPLANYSSLCVAPPPYAPNRTASSIKLQYVTGATFTAGTAVNNSDMLAKAAGPGTFDTIDYSLDSSASTVTVPPCPTGMLCLTRSVNGGPHEVVAYNISSMKLSYLFDDVSGVAETKAVPAANVGSIKAVRVTLTGIPPKNALASSSKQITTVVGLRNRRSF